MKTATCILLAYALSMQMTLFAQNFTSGEEQVKTAVDNCMSRVASGKADDAFSILFSEYWNVKSSAPQAASSMQRHYREVFGRARTPWESPFPVDTNLLA